MATPHEYYTSVIGKGFDMDGVANIQCVDGIKHFCKTVLGYDISKKSICSPSGYAYSIWDNYDKYFSKYFDKVASNEMVDGDWAIWNKGSKSCPDGHVAMFRKDNGNGTGVFLGQNQNGISNYTQANIYYDGIRGALRPKIYHQESSGEKVDQVVHIGSKVKFNGVFKVNGVSVADNTFTCIQLTGTPTKAYHHIPSTDFDECDANGNTNGYDQVITTGSYVKNDHTYVVKKIDKPTDSAMIEINGKDVWIFCGPLLEV